MVMDMSKFYGGVDAEAAFIPHTAVAASSALALMLLVQCVPAAVWVDSNLPSALSIVYTEVFHQHQNRHRHQQRETLDSRSIKANSGQVEAWTEFPSLISFLMHAAAAGTPTDLICFDINYLLRAMSGSSENQLCLLAAVDVEAAGVNWWYNNTRKVRDMTGSSSDSYTTSSTTTAARYDGNGDKQASDLPPLPSLLYRSSLTLQLLQQQEQR